MRSHAHSPRYDSVLTTRPLDPFGGAVLDLRVRTYFEMYVPRGGEREEVESFGQTRLDPQHLSVVWTATTTRPQRHMMGPLHPAPIYDGGVPLPGGV